ncbi:hypothetical protein EZV62_013626 [Acer yangbiense]|uniref:Cytochrome b5 heme-binding domain-containing protein n=1 Tax=Acer yangbiense TaxID=1000413 RepID=A0A5C7HYL6_9ROSI|nr:hypothetical protein EZV62_013626 [Acer yangbiense]
MEFTAQQLIQYNGTDPSKPIYVAIKGRVFDVTTGKSFYGPGGAYVMFAGKDASRALAKMSKNDEDITPSLDGLTEKEIGVLDDWEKKFEANLSYWRSWLNVMYNSHNGEKAINLRLGIASVYKSLGMVSYPKRYVRSQKDVVLNS